MENILSAKSVPVAVAAKLLYSFSKPAMIFAAAATAITAFVMPSRVTAGTLLDTIRARGTISCSIPPDNFAGFSELNSRGELHGMDVDLCRAVAAPVLGAPDRVRFVRLTWQARFLALQNGGVDLVPSTTPNLTREVGLGLQSSLPYYFGGAQFITRARQGIESAKDLATATVCFTAGTSVGQTTYAYLTALGIRFQPLEFDTTTVARQAYLAGRCDAFGGFGTMLAALRAGAPDPQNHVILPDVASLEPTVIAMRPGDRELTNAINYTISALIAAEEVGITASNLSALRASRISDPRIAQLLDPSQKTGERLGLHGDWAANAIMATGNYGEIYDRNLGRGSPLRLERGLNNLWSGRGMVFALPLN